jgi:hypothetical protein
MSDEDPPDSAPPGDESVPPPSPRSKESRRRRLEGVIPEIIKRAVELGVEKARESPENLKSFVGDMKVPKEIAHYLFAQIDETKNGLFRVVAKELRDFLEHTNFAGEMQKILTTVQFEVNTTIRFTPNDGRDKKKNKKEADKERDKKRASASPDDEEPPFDGDEHTPALDEDDLGDDGERDERSGDEGVSRPSSLPRPEVKTAVSVTRDERDRGRKRGKSS